jgi:hypothetical protein
LGTIWGTFWGTFWGPKEKNPKKIPPPPPPKEYLVDGLGFRVSILIINFIIFCFSLWKASQ